MKREGILLNVVILVLLLMLSIVSSANAQSKMYWREIGTPKIQRSNLDGSGVEELISGLSGRWMALDIEAGKMYWTNPAADKIQRSNLDGSGVEDVITSGLSGPEGIALDTAASKMYWTDVIAVKIQRANLDGSGAEDLITAGLSQPEGIVLDVGAGKMYWTDPVTDKIQRANLDGSGVEDLVTTGLWYPQGIALDVGSSKMYWTDSGADKIQRANLDGSGVEDLIATGLSQPEGIALDVSADKMYWTDVGTDKIQRANLDGTGIEDLITTGISGPFGIALALVADATDAFTYQGWLTDGSAAADGQYDFVFGLYEHPEGGLQVGRDIQVGNQQVSDGLFTVELAFGSDIFNGYSRWLEIGVRPGELEDPNVYVILSPRQQLTPSPYAIHAQHSGTLSAADGSPIDAVYVDEGGNVGIGTTNPEAKLEVRGDDNLIRARAKVDFEDMPRCIQMWYSGSIGPILQGDGYTRLTLDAYAGHAGDILLGLDGDDVGIGRSPTSNALEVEGTASKTSAGDWLANSDVRIKTDIENVTNALETLEKVRLVSFRYTDDYQAEHPSIDERSYLNVVAQEFAEVFPDYVKSSKEKLPNGDEILQVDAYPLTVYSAAAVQELHAIVKAKNAEITALKKHNDQIEARLAQMEAAVAKLTNQ